MALFERIGRKITDAGQEFAQQAKNLTDTSRLNAKIAENKKQMSQVLFEMGQDYYKKHRKETGNEEQEYIDRVNALFQEILQYEEEIKLIKTANVCKVCGARIEEDSSFCMSCGARLDETELEENVLTNSDCITFPVCCAAFDADSAFCTTCGAKLTNADVEYEENYEVDYEEPEEAYSARICPVCGTEAEDADVFCLNCGTKL